MVFLSLLNSHYDGEVWGCEAECYRTVVCVGSPSRTGRPLDLDYYLALNVPSPQCRLHHSSVGHIARALSIDK